MKSTAGIIVLVLVVIALVTGTSYEQAERARDRQRLPPAGRLIDIGGRSLAVDCAGAGSPAVIFETSAPRPGYSWIAIEREAAKFTRACWYDRAGFGWSDLGPYPRTSAASARDLHELLGRAGAAPPYVLAAETVAALDARVYTGFYPGEVAGMVLVDGVHPDLLMRFPEIRGKGAPVHKYLGYEENLASQFFNDVGLLRLMAANRRPAGPTPPGMTDAEWETVVRLANAPRARVALVQELSAMDDSIAAARRAGDLGSRPLRVISSGPGNSRRADGGMELQADLARLSTRGKQIVVSPAPPWPLYYQAPQAVIEAIGEVVREARSTR